MKTLDCESIALEWGLVKSLFNRELGLFDFYLSSYPYTSALVGTVTLMVITFVSCHTGKKNDFTLIDKLWPSITLLTSASYTLHSYLTERLSIRLLILLPIQTFWAYHLAELFARRGGYTGVEDHRWTKVKAGMNNDPILLFLFSIAFVSVYQPLMIMNNAMPELLLWEAGNSPLRLGDWFFIALQAGLVGLEYYIDYISQSYQVAKARYKNDGTITYGYTKAELERGFCTKGLYAYSRHPNFFAEQTIWIGLYAWGAYISGQYLNYSLIGPAVFFLFVVSSATFTESISAEKYPSFKSYMNQTTCLIPLPYCKYKEPKGE
ncbi:hypothetical protein V1512DRAFT_275058 [Lipomyces arxii]|uniref:uncharacterized protein n=1 Tax=Lipomyces arxii TaxID=56418 RepID=UPI0034CF4CC5